MVVLTGRMSCRSVVVMLRRSSGSSRARFRIRGGRQESDDAGWLGETKSYMYESNDSNHNNYNLMRPTHRVGDMVIPGLTCF